MPNEPLKPPRRRLAAGGKRPEELSLEALDALWEEVKGEEGRKGP